MNLKRIIKNAATLMHAKRVIPIQHVVDESKVLDGKAAIVIGGTGGGRSSHSKIP